MSAHEKISESVVEEAAIDWLARLSYEIEPGLTIEPGKAAAERSDFKQVLLCDSLQTKLKALNPKIPEEGLEEALRQIRRVSHPTLVENNRAFHRLLVEGVDAVFIEFGEREGRIVHAKVWLIDFANPEANEFLAVNQFTVEEGHFNRRADVAGFINRIPPAVVVIQNHSDGPAPTRKKSRHLHTY